MTIAIAWVRRIKDCEELIFVSDSRLSGDAINFDCCPKVIALPRNDCAIAFAGYTGHAYPMMSQLAMAIDSHAPAKRGSLDIAPLRKHALEVFNSMTSHLKISPLAGGDVKTTPGACFLFGGYSWIQKKFRLWSFAYGHGRSVFIERPAQWIGKNALGVTVVRDRQESIVGIPMGPISVIGDQSTEALALLTKKLDAASLYPETLNMEPFEVIRDMLRDPKHAETIGGPPQVVKVYQYMKSATLGVYWPDRASGKVTLHGRPCLGYERIDNWILDPDTLFSEIMSRPPEKGDAPSEI